LRIFLIRLAEGAEVIKLSLLNIVSAIDDAEEAMMERLRFVAAAAAAAAIDDDDEEAMVGATAWHDDDDDAALLLADDVDRGPGFVSIPTNGSEGGGYAGPNER
jgi:hypothetical protein